MKRRTIDIVNEAEWIRRVEAVVFGLWGVHLRVTDLKVPAPERWGVTHLPTGGQAFPPWERVTRNEAMACARALNRRLPRLGGEFGIQPPVSDDWRCARATIAEVLGEGRAR